MLRLGGDRPIRITCSNDPEVLPLNTVTPSGLAGLAKSAFHPPRRLPERPLAGIQAESLHSGAVRMPDIDPLRTPHCLCRLNAMQLPPHTPRQLMDGLAKKPSLRLRIARGWIVIGALMIVFIGAMAVAHYVYGMPVHDRNTGESSTPLNTLVVFMLLGGGGGFFLVMGVLLHRWKPA